MADKDKNIPAKDEAIAVKVISPQPVWIVKYAPKKEAARANRPLNFPTDMMSSSTAVRINAVASDVISSSVMP